MSEDSSVDPGRLSLGDRVEALRGVGPSAASRLGAAGIGTVGDLLRFFPRRAQAIVDADGPSEILVGQHVRLTGVVRRATRSWLPGRRSLVQVTFAAGDGGEFQVGFFNQPWQIDNFREGVERQFEGRLVRRGARFVLEHARVVSRQMVASGECVVRYSEIEGISEARLRALIDQALGRVRLEEALEDDLPAALAAEFPASADALADMHVPRSVAAHEQARRRFAIVEAIALFRDVERARRRRSARPGPQVELAALEHEARRRACIPFDWTTDQAQAVAAIRERLAGPAPMGVLLQGDVGTGKTAVALDAALAVAGAGFQVAFLAPTEMLAEQHFSVMSSRLASVGIRAALLTASRPVDERRAVEDGLASGDLAVVVGTHALLSPRTRFARLGLAVIDEQHRFGVDQRTDLVRKGAQPHVMVMTATPIPRTLTLTRFGDLDIEVLRERPAGRGPAPAVYLPRGEWPRVLRAIARHVRRRGRVYVVCPRIGEDGAKGGAVRLADELRRHFRSVLVHGRLPAEERQARTGAFRDGEYDVLVGTTVVEVGVDVSDATLMVIVGAERFGLATLHQLRGRVGRGRRRGVCLMTGERSPRVDAVCATTDGFELAELDLRLRGAGELLGARQSGSHDFRALDPVDDHEILRRARDAVRADQNP